MDSTPYALSTMWNHLYFYSATLRKYPIRTYLNFFFKMVDDLLQEATLFQQLKVVITQFCEIILRYPNVVQSYIFIEVLHTLQLQVEVNVCNSVHPKFCMFIPLRPYCHHPEHQIIWSWLIGNWGRTSLTNRYSTNNLLHIRFLIW